MGPGTCYPPVVSSCACTGWQGQNHPKEWGDSRQQNRLGATGPVLGTHLGPTLAPCATAPLCPQPGFTGSLLPSNRGDESTSATGTCQPRAAVTLFSTKTLPAVTGVQALSPFQPSCFSSHRLTYKTQNYPSTTPHGPTTFPEQVAAQSLSEDLFILLNHHH